MGVSNKIPADPEAMCPYRLVLEHLTSRWGVLVLIALLDRPYRFSELRRAVGAMSGTGEAAGAGGVGSGRGVSEKMLAQTLQTLERDGLIHRDAKPVIPPRVDYSLTDLGREAAEQVRGLAMWTQERMGAVQEAREVYDTRKAGSEQG
ncbi:helix-turn-helix domain-containing protein [Streptomyces sp. NPDC046909]|uniref:winged helix-turn-helix transcriptional regulator n=1 Tax=Streptomyces sp. NPDC046909 TaxID=3155617 RepID=UPI0033D48FD9